MEQNKMIIIALIVIIVALLAGIILSMPNTSQADDANVEADNENTVNETAAEVETPDSIMVELPEFDKTYTASAGEYTVEASKWMGSTVGGFDVHLYKNGAPVYKDSYLSRAYFYMDGEWKWSEWGNGQEGAEHHKYPVSNGVEIQKVEVKF